MNKTRYNVRQNICSKVKEIKETSLNTEATGMKSLARF